MVGLSRHWGAQRIALHHWLKRAVYGTVLVVGLGSASGGVWYGLAMKNSLGRAGNPVSPVAHVYTEPVPLPGPPPCVESFCVVDAVD